VVLAGLLQGDGVQERHLFGDGGLAGPGRHGLVGRLVHVELAEAVPLHRTDGLQLLLQPVEVGNKSLVTGDELVHVAAIVRVLLVERIGCQVIDALQVLVVLRPRQQVVEPLGVAVNALGGVEQIAPGDMGDLPVDGVDGPVVPVEGLLVLLELLDLGAHLAQALIPLAHVLEDLGGPLGVGPRVVEDEGERRGDSQRQDQGK